MNLNTSSDKVDQVVKKDTTPPTNTPSTHTTNTTTTITTPISTREALCTTKMTCACHRGQQMVFWNDGGMSIVPIEGYEEKQENMPKEQDPEWLLKDKPAGYKTKFGH